MKNKTYLALLLPLLAAPALAGMQNPFTNKGKPAEVINRTPEESAQKLMETNDFNKDGKLSTSEVNFSFRVRRFNRVDKNKDGMIDNEELIESFESTKRYQEQASAKADKDMQAEPSN